MTTAQPATITRNRLTLNMTPLRYELIKIQIETDNEHTARKAWGDEQVDRVLKSLGYSDDSIRWHRERVA